MSEAQQILPDPFLRMRVEDIACPAPVFAAPEDSVASAARSMARAGATAALVRANAAGELLGILTERDVLSRVVAEGRDASALAVSEVMTSPVLTARPGEMLVEAFSRMVRHAVRRLVVLDAAGRPKGVLGEGDILAARGESPLGLAAEINAAPDAPALGRAFSRLARLAARCVAEGLGSEPVGRLISEMHDRIMSRAWGLALAEVEAEAGPAPAPHSVLVLGSQARREQYLATDQDLALAYDGGPEHAEWFALLGARLTALLLQVGFPPCPKRIMLDNPDWRRGVSGWLRLAERLAERPDADGVVLASLLADLRPLPAPKGCCANAAAGPDLGLRLNRDICSSLARGPLLLKLMAREAVRFSPPLGVFRGFNLTRGADGRGSLDVKRGGVFPITQGVKVLALERGLPETSTLARLARLQELQALEPPLADGLREALALLQTLRMRAQAAAFASGLAPDNLLRPDDLGALEREGLRGAFKLVAELQGLLSGVYALHLLA